MLFELAHVPMPEGYGEALLSLEDCKAHLRVEGNDEDELVEALRDAAIEFVERYCGVKMGPVAGMVWRGEALFSRADLAHQDLGVWPVTGLVSVAWKDGGGADVDGDVAEFRVTERGRLRRAVGGRWPSGIAGDMVVTFDAGFAADECPPSLLQATRLMLAHLYMNREAVIVGQVSADAPLGVTALCAPFRPVRI